MAKMNIYYRTHLEYRGYMEEMQALQRLNTKKLSANVVGYSESELSPGQGDGWFTRNKKCVLIVVHKQNEEPLSANKN